MFQQTLNVARKYGAKASAGALALTTTGMAMAQEADPTGTAITAAGTKILGYATAVIGIMVAFWGVKRAGQKMGWW